MTKLILTSISLVLFLFAPNSYSQELVAKNQKNPMEVKDSDSRPKLDLNVTEKGDYLIGGVAFTKEQLQVLFTEIHKLNPKTILRVSVSSAADQRHVVDLLSTAVSANMSDVTFKSHSK